MTESTGVIGSPQLSRIGDEGPALLPLGGVALPMSPVVLTRVQAAIESGTANAAHVAAMIRTDPTLTATVLRLVNSAWFGLPQPIGRPTAAVAYLGLSEVHRLVVTASVINSFRSVAGPELRRIWHHATLTGLIARQLTKGRARWLSSSIAWTLGLLHDMGSLVRLTVEPDTEARIAAHVQANEALPEEAEATLGLTASTVWGRALAEHWRLPSLFTLVATHHRTGVAPRTTAIDDAAYLAMVSAASMMAHLVARPLREDVRAGLTTRVCMLLDCDANELWDLLASAHALNVEAEAALAELIRGA